jgi:exonuclease SbcC
LPRAAFLQASPDDRSPILEQITGTGIYSLISIKVHKRRRHEKEKGKGKGKLGLSKAELQGMQIISEEEEAELQEKIKENKMAKISLHAKLKLTVMP